MLHLNRLDYYAIPSLPDGWVAPEWLVVEVGMFAGKLFFDYSEYSTILAYLGYQPGAMDAAASKTNQEHLPRDSATFTTKPLTFIHEWLTIRRRGQEILHTPMGYVCQGRLLTEDHPFFRQLSDNANDSKVPLGGEDDWKPAKDTADIESIEDSEFFGDDDFYDANEEIVGASKDGSEDGASSAGAEEL